MSFNYLIESSGLSLQVNNYAELDPTFLYQSLSHQIIRAKPDWSPSRPPALVFQDLVLLARQSVLQFLHKQRIPSLRLPQLARALQGFSVRDHGYIVFDAIHQFYPFDFTIYCDGQLVKQLQKGGGNHSLVLIHNSEGRYDSVLRAERQLSGGLKIGSWNVNGAATPEKQLVIDQLCFTNQLDIVCLQEVHHHAQSIKSPHYEWILGSSSANRASRGCGFMILKTLKGQRMHFDFHQHYPDILQILVRQNGIKCFCLINVHLNSSDYTGRDILQLGGVLKDLSHSVSYLVCGDFNLYLGYM